MEEAKQHRLGYVGPSYLAKEASQDFILWSRLYYRNGIVFPISGINGEDIGLQLWSLEPTPDERPYRTFSAIHRDVQPFFFGMCQALPHIYGTGLVYLVEGVFDYFAVRRYHSACLSALTAGISVSARRFFKRFADRVVVLTDMDEAGREGLRRLTKEADGYHVVGPTYSEKDPDALIKAGKASELEKIIASTSNLLPHQTRV